jgi:AIG2-like family
LRSSATARRNASKLGIG